MTQWKIGHTGHAKNSVIGSGRYVAKMINSWNYSI